MICCWPGSKREFCSRLWNRRRSRPRRHARLFDFEDENEDDEHDIPGYQGSKAREEWVMCCKQLVWHRLIPRVPRNHSNLVRTGILAMLALFWVFGDQTGAAENPLIRRLQVQGTQRPVHLETRAGEPLERACVARDLRRLWASGWFDDIRVEVSGEPDAVEVVFYVVERPRYYLRRIKFEPASASRPVEIEPGTAMDKQRVHQIAVELQNQWLEQGYSDAEVHGEIVPVGLRQADLHLRLKLGRRYRVQEVRFSGTLGLNPKELVHGLRYTRSQRILPRLPGVWNGWQSHPAFSQQRLEAELESLRSLYFSRGYWNAAVTLNGLTFDEGEATVSLQVQSGPRHEISRAQVFGGAPGKEFSSSLRDAPVQALCHCLEQARRDS